MMCIIYAKNPSKNSAHIFLHGIDACPKFSARGYKFDKRHNECKHVFEAKKIPMDQIEAIGDKFLADGSGWFNKASFIMVDLKPKYRKLFGFVIGPEPV